MIDFEAVSVELGDTSVLEDVSLRIPEGTFVALVGPNGAGKTTLLRTCNGLVSPATGAVRVDGRHVMSASPREIGRLVATVPQETAAVFDFDVSAFVAMGRTPHRSRFETADDADRTAVESALERTDTARFADRSVTELSGGERQRVVFARALAQETPVLLLDEPTASLDINHQRRTLALARELVAAGKTVVAAIHDLDLAARFCDRIALLSGGTVLADGPPDAVLTADRIESAFGVRTAVGTNPATGSLSVTPLSGEHAGEHRVHVVGHGTGAARTIGRLAELGVRVSAGVVPAGDVAAVTAEAVAREVVTAPPFEPVSDDRFAAAADLVRRADAVVVAGTLGAPNRRLADVPERTFALRDAPDGHSSRPLATERELLDVLGRSAPAEPTAR
ncbi:ATP-binding cassette domain-containing protein [Natronomonas sp. LN261]|uniref:ATP-binding cassette domain-containing protein n=1 Tax=Natronomonas sp. LN261 TaxID=2750669 RepID=UPI0015EEEE07